MELIGKLKKNVDKASTKEEKRELIEEAGMKLNDVELEMITGGFAPPNPGAPLRSDLQSGQWKGV